MRFMSILLLQALHSFLKIYLNVITTLHIFSDGHIYVKVLEYFSLMLDQLQCTHTFDFV